MKMDLKVFCVHKDGNFEAIQKESFDEDINVSFVCSKVTCQREIVVSLRIDEK